MIFLKKVSHGLLRNSLVVETNEDGSIPEGQGMAGWIVKQLESFSFEETIKKLVSGVFGRYTRSCGLGQTSLYRS